MVRSRGNKMKRAWSIALLLGTVATSQAASAPVLVNGIEAIVHDSIITQFEVESLTVQAAELLYRQYENEPEAFQAKMAEVRKDNLTQLIDQQLILQEFKKFNIPESILDKDVDRQIEDIVHSGYYGDRMRLIKSLQAKGTSLEHFRQQRRESLIIGYLREKNISSAIIISPHKVETYYLAHREDYKQDDEVKLRMIVLKESPDTTAPQVLKLASEIAAKLKEGANFAEMATVYSQGSQRKDGGDWGWKDHSFLNKGLADIAFSLEKGKSSDVLSRTAGDDYWMLQYDGDQPKVGRHYAPDPKSHKETLVEERHFDGTNTVADLPAPVEFYLMLVEDKHPSHYKALGEVREEIEKNLALEEKNRLQKEWTERLHKKTFVRTF